MASNSLIIELVLLIMVYWT